MDGEFPKQTNLSKDLVAIEVGASAILTSLSAMSDSYNRPRGDDGV